MKIHIVILSLILLLSACFESKNSATEISPKELQNSKIILEIYEEFDGMRGVAGKILLFRLYENGIAEFDAPNAEKKNVENSNRAKDIFSLKRVRISDEDIIKFHRLMTSEDYKQDFQITKDEYQSKCCCTDDSGTNFITSLTSDVQEKIVSINNVCDINQLTNRDTANSADIPVSLSEVIRLAYVTQLKYLAKK